MPIPKGNVEFSGGSSSTAIEILGPQSGQRISEFPRFVSDSAADGTRYAYRTTRRRMWRWELPFGSLSTTHKLALSLFFEDNAEGPSNLFWYTHSDGKRYRARFAQTELEWQSDGPNQWGTNVILETEHEPGNGI